MAKQIFTNSIRCAPDVLSIGRASSVPPELRNLADDILSPQLYNVTKDTEISWIVSTLFKGMEVLTL